MGSNMKRAAGLPLTQACGSCRRLALQSSVHKSLGGASQHGSMSKTVKSTAVHSTHLRKGGWAKEQLTEIMQALQHRRQKRAMKWKGPVGCCARRK